jgi:hypothetical protein
MSACLLSSSAAALVGALSLIDFVPAARAQGAEAWEYAYLVEVDRLVHHDGQIEGWSASRADKDYFRAHVFAYELGFSSHDRTLNRLKRINSLAEEGWAVSDAETGLLVRRR